MNSVNAQSSILMSNPGNTGDFPAEVLMSLPSPEEILRRAEEAKAKAAAALAANQK